MADQMPAQSSQPLSVVTYRDFTGGLNLAAPKFNIAVNELSAARDVVVNDAGGVEVRPTVKPFVLGDAFPSPVQQVWSFEAANNGFLYTFFQLENGQTWLVPNGPALPINVTQGSGGTEIVPSSSNNRWHSWDSNGVMYFSNGVTSWKWDNGVKVVGAGAEPGGFGSTQKVNTGDGFHPEADDNEVSNLGVLSNVDATTWRGVVMAIGVPVDGDTANGIDHDTLWWSNALYEQPTGATLAGQLAGHEDFYETRRFSFNTGLAADYARRVVNAGRNLYVFKRKSIHAVAPAGSGISEFFITDIATDMGICGDDAVDSAGDTTFFFDDERGLMALQGDGSPVWLFQKMMPLLRRMTNPESTQVCVYRQRVYVSLAIGHGTRNNMTIVYDVPTRSWVSWDIGFDRLHYARGTNSDGYLIGCVSDPSNSVVFLSDVPSMYDDFGGSRRKVKPLVRTAWWDDGLPYIRKRWTGSEFVMSATGDLRVRLDASLNWEDFSNPSPAVVESLSAGYDDVFKVDSSWAAPDVREVVEPGDERFLGGIEDGYDKLAPVGPVGRSLNGPPLGHGRSIQLSVQDAGSEEPWSLDQVTVFYRPKRARY